LYIGFAHHNHRNHATIYLEREATTALSMPRLIYNRVAKAGSTTMLALLSALSSINNFEIVSPGKVLQYFPTREHLSETLHNLPDNHVYVNHCAYLDGLPPDDYIWINMVRDPVELEESNFYYSVADSRLGGRVTRELKRRHKDPCGCHAMEFDACIKSYMVRDECSYRLSFNHSLKSYFTEASDNPCAKNWPDESHCYPANFTASMAFQRVQKSYFFVGILEEFELSVKVLEKTLPRFFANATSVLKSMTASEHHYNRTPPVNKRTNTSMGGAISTHVREALMYHNAEDMKLYENIKRLFWWKVVKLFPEAEYVQFAQ
jgi:dermatan/chondrotin sulfate uronyl 2-O-sulfotransferase UST